MSAAIALAAFCGAEIFIACLPGFSARGASDLLEDTAQRGMTASADIEFADGSRAPPVADAPVPARNACEPRFRLGDEMIGADFRLVTSAELARERGLLLRGGAGSEVRLRRMESLEVSSRDQRHSLDAAQILQLTASARHRRGKD